MDTKKLLAAAFAGAMITASPSDAATRHTIQLKNCVSLSNTWQYNVYNADDVADMVPYMTINFSAVDQVKSGRCAGAGKGFCKVVNTAYLEKFRVESTKTVYGDTDSLREYTGLLDCNSEPAH